MRKKRGVYAERVAELATRHQLGELINRAYIDYHLPMRLQHYEHGEKLMFDISLTDNADDDNIRVCTLEISRRGMKQVLSVLEEYGCSPEMEKEEFISWDEIASIEREGQYIVVKTREPYFVEEASRASDIWLMVEHNP